MALNRCSAMPDDSARENRPLAVDLDGTLLKTDLLVESFLGLLKHNFLLIFFVPWWLLRGKAYLKERIAQRVDIDVEALPYQFEFLSFLVAEHAKGRKLILATASHRRYADAVARHLGIFERVIATEYPVNRSGREKLQYLVQRYGEKGFDYAGNARIDLNIWPHAQKAILVNPDWGVRAAAQRCADVANVFADPPGGLAVYLRALRLHQWVKNVLVFVPILAAHRIFSSADLWNTTLAFLAFCLTASGAYLLNDLLDLDADRKHPRKRNRPFASGDVPVIHGLLLAPLLLVVAAGISAALSPYFAGVLALYYGITLTYSLKLKGHAMLDVMVLAGLYTLRIIAGSLAVEAMPSFWLLGFSMFIFLSLALVKRYSELLTMSRAGRDKATGRGYQVGDLIVLMAAGLSSGYLAVMVLALYINSPQVQVLYSRPEALWLVCPLALYWISRIWMITHRGDMHDDPIVFTFRDLPSLLIGVICAGIGLVAA